MEKKFPNVSRNDWISCSSNRQLFLHSIMEGRAVDSLPTNLRGLLLLVVLMVGREKKGKMLGNGSCIQTYYLKGGGGHSIEIYYI